MAAAAAEGAQVRPTVRVLLIDADERVLLFHMHSDDGQVFWCPPGGGVEEGETHEDAARRELTEETGWADPRIGPRIGSRRHLVSWSGVRYDCHERWYLARVGHLTVDTAGFTDEERATVMVPRWWSVAEMAASPERMVPADLADVVEGLLRDGPPLTPVEFGV